MSGYGQFCPVAAAAEVLTERWTPLMSSSPLARRLRKLQRVGMVERRTRRDGPDHEYHLTRAGKELGPLVWRMPVWGRRWAKVDVSEEEPDVALLMQRPDVDLCLTDPGFGTDLVLRSEPRAMTAVFMVDLSAGEALRQRAVRVEGPEHLARALPTWLGVSPFASVQRASCEPAAARRAGGAP
jgi:hypothetical protein